MFGQDNDPVPEGFFKLEELTFMLSFQGFALWSIDYYLWITDREVVKTGPSKFLYAVELAFESGNSLFLCEDEDSHGITIIKAHTLIERAIKLKQVNGHPVLQRMGANQQPTWRGLEGAVLRNIRLNISETGLYSNDAIHLQFTGGSEVMLYHNQKQGLSVGRLVE